MKLFYNNDTSLSNNALLHRLPDFFIVLLLTFLGQTLLQNPIVGLAAGLLVAFWQNVILYRFIQDSLSVSKRFKVIFLLLTVLSSGACVLLIILHPYNINGPKSIFLLFVTALILCKNIFSVFMASGIRKHRLIKLSLVHACFDALYIAVILISGCTSAPSAIIGYLFIDILTYIRNAKHPFLGRKAQPSPISQIASYRLFSQTSLYVSISFYLAIFTFMGFTTLQMSHTNAYTLLLLWIVALAVASLLIYKLACKLTQFSVAIFIAGAIAWATATVRLFNSKNLTSGAFWSFLLTVGIALMYVWLYRQNECFKQVSCIIDEDISSNSLMQATDITQSVGFAIAAIIQISTIIIRTYVFPHSKQLFSSYTLFLPFVFIILSVILALCQPLDASSLDKLEKLKQENKSEMQQYLHNILIKKYRKRYGVRIIAFFVKPFLYHKVYGKENVRDNTLPAVFVCNHGEIYGPAVAVTHLPYYFRPWSHAEMLSYPAAKERIYNGTILPMRIPDFIKKPVAGLCARLAVWALNSFDPVAVHLGNIRQVYKTMQDSVKVLAEGDSLLLFPENPQHEQNGRYSVDSPGSFYTGFAQIGLEYYKKHGKSVTFYPVYASKTKRTFRIGKGVVFDSNNNRHDEKLRIATELEKAMKEMSRL